MKKKLLFKALLFATLTFTVLFTSCGGSGGGSSDDVYDETSSGFTVSSAIDGSRIFIEGRTVILWAKWCCDHEVTQAEYKKYCTFGGSSPSSTYGVGDNYPAYYVSWYDALVYCNKRSIAEGLTPCYTISGKTNPSDWGSVPTSSNATWNAATCNFNANGYRLPTEAEWEYFARGGNTTNSGQTTYSGSNTIGDVAWYSDNSSLKTHEVKKKAKNSLNLSDMSGNVWEWCWDWLDISISASTASTGASSGSYRVVRGGSWRNDASSCSVACRGRRVPYDRGDYFSGSGSSFGFRVVRTAD